MKTYVVYHFPCFDGFCAAWAARRALGEGDDVEFVPANYGDDMPEFPEDANVIMVDVSWPRGDMLRLKESVGDLVVLDHHHTARDNLSGLEFATFDMDKSGARLAWEFFHPGEEPPAIVRYVEDRDLWRFDLPHTRTIHAFLSTFPFDFEAWDEAADILEHRHAHALGIGTRVLQFSNLRHREAAEQAHVVQMPSDDNGSAGKVVLAVNNNLKHFVSETLHLLLDEHDVDMVASYSRGPDGSWYWSLRSREDFDCSAIARRYKGGGGHKNAAGFQSEHPPTYLGGSEKLEEPKHVVHCDEYHAHTRIGIEFSSQNRCCASICPGCAWQEAMRS